MAVIGNVSSADFQPAGDMTDNARPPGDPDLIERPAVRGRQGLPEARRVGRPGHGRRRRRGRRK
jgi:hypothetical protein